MEARVRSTVAVALFSGEGFLSPGFHQQRFEPSTECRPALSFVAFDVYDFILEAHSNPVHFDGLASSFFGKPSQFHKLILMYISF